jgi:SWI/SNF-related matrix-associated actin-dependent regulator of chromatin subfamily A-like protein 1
LPSFEKIVQANLTTKEIEISSPYIPSDIEVIRSIDGRRWSPKQSVWLLPLTEWHARQVIEKLAPLGFTLDSRLHKFAEVKKKVSVTYVMNRDGLFPFQSEGVDFIHKNKGRVILADSMGLGKTITSLGWIRERTDLKKILIICPASLTFKWKNEILKWVSPDETVQVVTSGKQPLENVRFLIMSYALMVSKFQELKPETWNAAIIDEAHKAKELKSQRSRCLHALTFEHVLLLSGTPMLNRPVELYSLLNLLNPVEWYDWFKYCMKYCNATKNYFGWDMTGASNLEELKGRLQNYMIRRTAQEVMPELPELTRTRVPIEVKRTEIKAALDSLQVWVEENGVKGKSRAEAMVRVGKLRQAIGLAKVPAVIEMIEDVLESEPTKKIVIYAFYHSVVQAFETGLSKYSVSKITGEIPQEERENRKIAFQTKARPQIMIISPAGGEGIDLYASSLLFMAERDWVPGIEEQIEARLKRYGQKNAVEAIYPIAQSTIDVEMDLLVEKKRAVFRELIGLDDVKTTEMVFEDIINLIKKGE